MPLCIEVIFRSIPIADQGLQARRDLPASAAALATALRRRRRRRSRPKTSSKPQANDGFSYSSSGQRGLVSLRPSKERRAQGPKSTVEPRKITIASCRLLCADNSRCSGSLGSCQEVGRPILHGLFEPFWSTGLNGLNCAAQFGASHGQAFLKV